MSGWRNGLLYLGGYSFEKEYEIVIKKLGFTGGQAEKSCLNFQEASRPKSLLPGCC